MPSMRDAIPPYDPANREPTREAVRAYLQTLKPTALHWEVAEDRCAPHQFIMRGSDLSEPQEDGTDAPIWNYQAATHNHPKLSSHISLHYAPNGYPVEHVCPEGCPCCGRARWTVENVEQFVLWLMGFEQQAKDYFRDMKEEKTDA
jgi:hypothetical protein